MINWRDVILFLPDCIFGKAPEIICGSARLTRRREDGPIVLFQKNDPRADVVGMTELTLDAEMRAQERSGELRDKLLGRDPVDVQVVDQRDIASHQMPDEQLRPPTRPHRPGHAQRDRGLKRRSRSALQRRLRRLRRPYRLGL